MRARKSPSKPDNSNQYQKVGARNGSIAKSESKTAGATVN